jgi:uncharacterized protein (TIGR03083 family)
MGPALLARLGRNPEDIRKLEPAVESDPREWIATLRNSHDRLAVLVEPLTPEQLREQSYDTEWSVAQVLSHLGSGAEISLMGLDASLGQGTPPSRDDFPPIWDKWNAKSPDKQAADAIAIDEQHVSALEQLSDDQLASMRTEFFGLKLDAVGIIRLRLGEHALHTWDVAVQHDPAATVAPDAATLLIDNVSTFLAPRVGRPLGVPFAVRITTTDPGREYLLISDDAVTVTDWPGNDAPTGLPHLTMPAESLLRLAYGRLDDAHTPSSVSGDTAALDTLRAIFPGF